MKYLFRTSLGLLLLSIGFLGNIDVNAKSVDISKIPIINYYYSGLVYGTATSINEFR